MPTTRDLVLEICDYNWERLYVTPNVVSANVTRELGAIGEGEVTLPAGDPAIDYLPDPASALSNEGRWRLYEDGELTFAGVVDQTTRRINSDNTYTFGGKHRGILLGQSNMGRRNFSAWTLQQIFEELLRDNIAKAPIASIEERTSATDAHPAISAITGDVIKNQYWATSQGEGGLPHFMTIDLGDDYDIVGVRVIPPYWDNRWYNFRVLTSSDGSSFDDQGGYEVARPLHDKGKYIDFTANARYVKVKITDSSDGFGRLASVLVYRQLATVGSDTDYVIPWIENDDSGNITKFGSTQRFNTPGAFNGDGVIGNSLTTRLNTGGRMDHRFRGTATAAYFTQGKGGGQAKADIYLDGNFQETVTLPFHTYQYEGYRVENLPYGVHYLSVRQNSGTPQVDYFAGLYKTSFRKVRDDDTSIGYYRGWSVNQGEHFTDFSHHRTSSQVASNHFEFVGDEINVILTKRPNYGKQEFKMDGSTIEVVDQYAANDNFQQNLVQWSGSYGSHGIRGIHNGDKNGNSSGFYIDLDEYRGNFDHIVYMRSFWESNLRLLTRLSEITQTFLRFNDDGSVDMLGKVGEWSETIVREGENEGGNIIEADITDDYSETASAVLALVTQPDGPPIKAFVIDKNAVARMGLKIRKVEFADANDAYLLTRQAWSELQDHVQPIRRYSVQFDHGLLNDEIEVGETTKLYAPSIGLTGGDEFRVGRLVTDFDTEEATDIPSQ
jgi:hypothetical protein